MNEKMSAELAAEMGVVLGDPYTPPGRTGVFDVPSYDDVADLVQLFKRFGNTAVANGGDTMNGTYNFTGKILVNGQPINPSDAYEISDRSAGFTVTIPEVLVQTRYMCNFSTDQTIVMPADGSTLPDGARITIVQTGKGKVTINGLNVTGTQKTKLQYQALEVMWHGNLWWCLAGAGGGGGGGEGTPVKPVIAFDAKFETINWSPVSGTAGPTLGYGALVTPSEDIAWEIKGTTLTILRATAGVEYSFEVWGVNAAGQGDISDPIAHKWDGAAAPVLTCLSGAAQFTANWNAISGAEAYNLAYKKQTDSSWTEVLLGPVTTKVITGLNEQVAYLVRVQAIDGPVASPWSNEVGVTPGPGFVDPPEASKNGAGTWQITNYEEGLIYEITGPGVINGTGVVTVTDGNGTARVGVKRAVGSPEEFIWLSRLQYTYTQDCRDFSTCSCPCGGQPECGNCTAGCTWSCCGNCGDSGGGGYGCCICRGPGYCISTKNGTPSGYTDSYGEWWRQSYTAIVGVEPLVAPVEGFYFDGVQLSGWLPMAKGTEYGASLLSVSCEGQRIAVFSVATDVDCYWYRTLSGDDGEVWLKFDDDNPSWADGWDMSKAEYSFTAYDLAGKKALYDFSGSVVIA